MSWSQSEVTPKIKVKVQWSIQNQETHQGSVPELESVATPRVKPKSELEVKPDSVTGIRARKQVTGAMRRNHVKRIRKLYAWSADCC